MSEYNLKYGILIFGTGAIYRRFYRQVEKIPTVMLLDNNHEKCGTELNGIKIVSPQTIKSLQYDKIILMSDSWEEMKEQLLMMDVPSDYMISYHELDRFIYEVKDRKKLIRGKKRCLFLIKWILRGHRLCYIMRLSY